ncbi:MAG TPA: selenocysteine-specific translation elongation factor [Verrucomicrobiales bacterium]|nr:selenocysteine-specific translation elongation factor [Verrucomicrobiales bacterium]
MPGRHYILGTAGHIDHGKSSLVEALTGTNPDRLPEEKARGMTIDLGFAHLSIEDPEDQGLRYELGLIDVPGHADFVKNMVAGVGSIDVALLVVAADDVWMPQTEEHVQILSYLGVRRMVVALTKVDLAENPAEAEEEVRLHLEGTVFAGAEVVHTAAPVGKGLEDLRRALVEVLRELPESADCGRPRLFVDRAFSPRGVGTVVTGTLSGGRIAKGQDLEVLPAGHRTHVRTIQSHNAELESAGPGMRTALNLSDLVLGERGRKAIARGDIVTVAGLGEPSDTLDVFVERCEREIPGQPASLRPIRNGQRVRFHHGSGSHGARIFFATRGGLAPGESELAELRFERPVYAFLGDRFVLRDWPKTSSLAGGVVLDPDARRDRFRRPEQRAFLEIRSAAPGNVKAALRTLLERDRAVLAPALQKARFARGDIDTAARALESEHVCVRQGNWLIAAGWWKQAVHEMGRRIDFVHRQEASRPGMAIGDLRREVEERLPHKELFEALLKGIEAQGFERVGSLVRRRGHRAVLPPELRVAGDRIRRALAEAALEPPNPKELAPSAADQRALQFLISSGEAVDLGEKCVLSAEQYDRAHGAVIAALKRKGKATVSELRQELGTTRRILMPILDRLDRERVTVRLDDYRFLSKSFLRGEEEGDGD